MGDNNEQNESKEQADEDWQKRTTKAVSRVLIPLGLLALTFGLLATCMNAMFAGG